MRQLGEWLDINGEAIYSSSPWSYQNDSSNSDVWYTSKVSPVEGVLVYGVVLQWPDSGSLVVTSPQPADNTVITLLGWPGESLDWSEAGGELTIHLPHITPSNLTWAWVIKFVHLSNGGNSLL